MLKSIELTAPGLIATALEQAVCVPSDAPMRITLVLSALTPAKVAIPLEALRGLEVAVTPDATDVAQVASE